MNFIARYLNSSVLDEELILAKVLAFFIIPYMVIDGAYLMMFSGSCTGELKEQLYGWIKGICDHGDIAWFIWLLLLVFSMFALGRIHSQLMYFSSLGATALIIFYFLITRYQFIALDESLPAAAKTDALLCIAYIYFMTIIHRKYVNRNTSV